MPSLGCFQSSLKYPNQVPSITCFLGCHPRPILALRACGWLGQRVFEVHFVAGMGTLGTGRVKLLLLLSLPNQRWRKAAISLPVLEAGVVEMLSASLLRKKPAFMELLIVKSIYCFDAHTAIRLVVYDALKIL